MPNGIAPDPFNLPFTLPLVAIVKKELKLERSLYEILQILSVALFEKTPIFQALTSLNFPNEDIPRCNQLPLFDL